MLFYVHDKSHIVGYTHNKDKLNTFQIHKHQNQSTQVQRGAHMPKKTGHTRTTTSQNSHWYIAQVCSIAYMYCCYNHFNVEINIKYTKKGPEVPTTETLRQALSTQRLPAWKQRYIYLQALKFYVLWGIWYLFLILLLNK